MSIVLRRIDCKSVLGTGGAKWRLLLPVLPLLVLGESTQPPAFLREPDYHIQKQGDVWSVRKPKLRVLEMTAPAEAWTVYSGATRAAAEKRMTALPRLRLNRPLVQFDPVTRERKPIENWTSEPDAQEAAHDVDAIASRFGSPAARALISSTPVYLARLNGAFAHTAEEPDDSRRFVIYLDPFRATGRLHAAATLAHELVHVERYRVRGFHANRAASVLPGRDFILLAAADELEAVHAEAALITAFLNGLSTDVREAAKEAMPSGQFRWPKALIILLGFESPADPETRMNEARRQIALDLNHQAARYWAFHHFEQLPRDLRTTITDWHSRSPEWRDIARQRPEWARAGADVQAPAP